LVATTSTRMVAGVPDEAAAMPARSLAGISIFGSVL